MAKLALRKVVKPAKPRNQNPYEIVTKISNAIEELVAREGYAEHLGDFCAIWVEDRAHFTERTDRIPIHWRLPFLDHINNGFMSVTDIYAIPDASSEMSGITRRYFCRVAPARKVSPY